MSGTITFNRTYADYDPSVRDFEKAPEISEILSYVLCTYNYPVSALIGGKFSAVWLKEGDRKGADKDDLDLIFEMRDQGFFEIILRDENYAPVYGGYLLAGKSVTVTDEVVSGYRVIVVTHDDHSETRHEFQPGIGYEPVYAHAVGTLSATSRRKKRGLN